MVTLIIKWTVRARLGDMRDLDHLKRVFEGRSLPDPRGVRFRADTIGGVAGEWAEAGGDRPLLYLHGGGFVGCSPKTHRSLTGGFARRGFRVFAPDYRLAPKHPFPAAFDDALAAWRGFAARVGAPAAIAGDSAGGNLAAALTVMVKNEARRPAAAVLFSPATDMTGGGESWVENRDRDAMFTVELANLRDFYLAGADPRDPRASPLFGDLSGLPPVLLHVGESELLRDDSVRFAEAARAAGSRAELKVWNGAPHVWQFMHGFVPEARRSIDEAAAFLRESLEGAAAVSEVLDVLIVGAGLSGVGMACHLQRRCPWSRYAILEARGAIGGTWDLFRYPGVRSDSDMFTLGYAFRPWTQSKSIADGPSILGYVRETAAEYGVDRHIAFETKVVSASWDSGRAQWRVEAERGGERVSYAARFLSICAGYYRYDRGYFPEFPGLADFAGRLVHPQFWPEDLDYAGKRVLVIGSGATAVTIVPEIAKTAAGVTMLQRSPTYMFARPSEDAFANGLRAALPAGFAYKLTRLRNVLQAMYFYRLFRKYPEKAKRGLIALARAELGPDADPADFTPRYNVWDQRLCLVPDADLFHAVRDGRAKVVTDEIETFTAGGVRTRSGRALEADIVVVATGLEVNVLGDVAFDVDGAPVDFARRHFYKACMYEGVPNLVSVFGYTNSSWTLKADLIAGYACRLLNFLRERGLAAATPPTVEGEPAGPVLDLTSGYIQRAAAKLPRQGARAPWRVYQNYARDVRLLRFGRIDDGVLRFARAPATAAARRTAAE